MYEECTSKDLICQGRFEFLGGNWSNAQQQTQRCEKISTRRKCPCSFSNFGKGFLVALGFNLRPL